ncbi:unnamed protein product [Paramecium pentaurelia]|uniref:Transmembrane protein n=1 Tax=Paramecium pentaurelia TaxID=43138 RepID=A0A8S1YHS3_9CILI|nr:unnamed protein product [Paramecium pentaurelia]
MRNVIVLNLLKQMIVLNLLCSAVGILVAKNAKKIHVQRSHILPLACNENFIWANDLCQDFSDCQILKESSKSSCVNQNIYCPASNGTNCQFIDNLQNCKSITTKDNCNNYQSAAGLCIQNGQKCILPTSCSQLSNSIYPSCNLNKCTYNKETYQFLPRACLEYQEEIKCSQGVLNLVLIQIMLQDAFKIINQNLVKNMILYQ